MKKVCLFFFSGTGMTEIVINKIKRGFENRHIYVDCVSIENVKPYDVRLTEFDLIGFAYPVHSFNAPKRMVNFVKALSKTDCMDGFIISTAGEGVSINHASSCLLIKILNKKGVNVFYDKQFAMPSNFVVKHSNDKAMGFIEEMNKDIPATVDDLMSRTSFTYKCNLPGKLVAFIGRLEWIGAPILGKFFYASKGCSRCGKCVRNCPNQNIAIKDEIVCFGWHCGLCMRCLYQCPSYSIDVRWPFKFIRLESWYDFSLLEDDRTK